MPNSENAQLTTDPNNGAESAFPLPHGTTQVKRWQAGYGQYKTTEAVSTSGLTKREYFAALALQGLLTQPTMPPDGWSKMAVFQADDLLKELAK